MTRTLLFACDLSAENRAAFGRAIRLARETGARLDVLHVLDPYLPHAVLHDLEQAVVAEMEHMLTDIREDYALPAPECLIQTVTGAPYAEIIREAHERDVEMIVMGVHRKRGHPDLVAGSTLARVLRGAPCPVISASHPPTQTWREILVPLDFSLTCRNALRETLKRFPAAHLTLLHAWELPGERELGSTPSYAQWRDTRVRQLRRQLEAEIETLMATLDDVPELELELEQGNPEEVLMNRLRRQPPDLLAMGSRGDWQARGQLSDKLLAEPHCDVMVCRAW
ncbi:universal stress protein [Onishia niordana]|uniref:universal stress protein n=1 Tax=Onishia niordana TaxID=2508711 RepID=UPI00109EEF2A|nr:universal stress protein [Halomonas niordiana]